MDTSLWALLALALTMLGVTLHASCLGS